jgi:zinc-ribbon domain
MPDPEIDRRCVVCGAAVRPRAVFCPQCGQPVNRQTESSDGRPSPDLAETRPLTAVPDVGETLPLRAIPDLSETQPLIALPPTVASPATPHHNPNQPATASVARVSEEHVKGPVGKLRKASSVVIDQAAYDPSIRFLLVAAALFLLFLVLLVLSKVIG